jgi:HAD superfamily hydrolase (TIGR01509 family)
MEHTEPGIDWSAIDAVGLDVMDTVLYDPFREAIERVTAMGLERVGQLRDRSAYHEFELGRLTEREYGARFFLPDSGLQLDAGRLWRELERGFAFLPGMEALLERLARRATVHTLSNYSMWYERIRERFGLDRFVASHFPSYRVGRRKPDPRYFEHVLARTGLLPAQLLFVDDRRVNVEGARGLGMPALLFEGAERLARDLDPLLRRDPRPASRHSPGRGR